ncbi:MAG: hypothetical protein GWM98_13545 [Nitrospinaceae bacterium]|nr:hypothetical protein [Nitrospinaceae bacterium]NIR55308.1 hypothetical protein [Nitrospinaceae bacterium]NIS85747.1 hypothetical protein [Nitrospinaceae bacterium]NIT82597.1 hypothetical protein [Nitrospinaceae bacterium]NIU44802.1 hypothetical protein [Nitrospinaceae bacterium]
MNRRFLLLLLGLSLALQACVTPKKPPKELLSLTEAQMKIRSFQTRTFEVKDQNKVLRGVVASLQDLGFIVERANGPMGLVTAGKFGPGGVGFVEITVTVRAKGETSSEVRANALYNTKPIEDPKVYQNFFAAVQRSLFLPG